jgi:hypothetical protein
MKSISSTVFGRLIGIAACAFVAFIAHRPSRKSHA